MAARDAEMAVLYLLLTSTEACSRALECAKDRVNFEDIAEVFSNAGRKTLVSAALDHYRRYSVVVDRDVLEHRFARYVSDIRVAALEQYAYALDSPVASGDNFDYWWAVLCETRMARQLKNSMDSALTHLEHDQVKEAYDMLLDQLTTLREVPGVDERSCYSIVQTAEERWTRYIDAMEHPEKYRGLMTGFDELDTIHNGAHPGELWVAISRTSGGKSVLLNAISHNLWVQGSNVFHAGLEMPPEASAMRFDALHARLRHREIRDATLSDEDREFYHDALMGLTYTDNDVVYCEQRKCQTMLDIQMQVVLQQRRLGLKFDALVVDYLNIVRPTITVQNRHMNAAHEFQREVAEEARALGILHGIPVFTAAQASRKGAESEIKSKDVGTEIIALSDFIGNTADLSLFLRRTQQDVDDNTMTCVVLKARNGEKKAFKLRCNLDQMYLGNLESAPLAPLTAMV